jgi:hypothetical protein
VNRTQKETTFTRRKNSGDPWQNWKACDIIFLLATERGSRLNSDTDNRSSDDISAF